MRVSVVINTYNRGRSLRTTLTGLRYQTYRDFEVVVVNGPSTDDTDDVLNDFDDWIRAYRCPDVHLSKSRNIGITHAAGDVIAFIDDDAIPEPNWITDLIAGYDAPDVGGVGGVVYDHTGVSYQYQFSLCSRIATTRFDVQPPFDVYNRPGADPFVYLQGTNCSFRRDLLVEIGGFNEEIEYYLDEVEVCMRGIDAGYRMMPVANAVVHHKYLPSHLRNNNRVVLDPFSTVKNHCTFAVRNGTRTRTISEVLEEITKYISIVKAGGQSNFEAGRMTATQLEHYLRRTERGLDIGVRQGLTKPRPIRHLPSTHADDFKPYATIRPTGDRLTVAFATREYPPACGGVGRYISDLAKGFAGDGHQVHVVTHSASNTHTVDFEDGVWMHRIPDVQPKYGKFRELPTCYNFTHVANVYHEVSRIHERHGLDLMVGPIWLTEGAICQLDDRWPTVLSLQTSMKTIHELGGTSGDAAQVNGMIALETAAVRRAKYIHGISHAILAKAKHDFAPTAPLSEHVVHIGTRDERDRFARRRPADDKVRILFVGRIEARKGVDVLLRAAYQVLPEFPNAELVLIGKYNPSGNDTATTDHQLYMADHPDLHGRIIFAGEKTDDELMQAYSDADVVVLPSRYESFGLVLTEGMMFGKPVVASRVGGMVEIVADGENGYLVTPNDPAAFAVAFRKLLASADLREQFGRRSREIYEERFSTTVMVKNTVDCFRQIARDWKGRKHHQHPDREIVSERLTALVNDVTGADADTVAGTVSELLAKQFRTGGDHAAELARLWSAAPEDFIRGLYDVILKRPADAHGLSWHLDYLTQTNDRLAVVELLIRSDEARVRGLDTSWYARFVPPLAPPPPPLPAASPPPGLKHRVKRLAGKTRNRLRGVPFLGRGLRFLKYSLMMPVAVRRLIFKTDELNASLHAIQSQVSHSQEPAIKQVRELQQQLADRLNALERQAQARDRQMQWVLAQQAQLLDELLAAQSPNEARKAA